MQFILLLSVVATAIAHMKIKDPIPRDNNGLRSLTGPCGEGFDSPVEGIRTSINVKDFKISIQVADEDAQVIVNAGIGPDPKTFDFEVANFPASLENIEFSVDFTKMKGLKNGDSVTVQIVEKALDGVKFGCIDLTLNGLAIVPTTVESVTSIAQATTSLLPGTTFVTIETIETTSTAVETSPKTVIISSASTSSSIFTALFLLALL